MKPQRATESAPVSCPIPACKNGTINPEDDKRISDANCGYCTCFLDNKVQEQFVKKSA